MVMTQHSVFSFQASATCEDVLSNSIGHRNLRDMHLHILVSVISCVVQKAQHFIGLHYQLIKSR
jgi:hypothetical protein